MKYKLQNSIAFKVSQTANKLNNDFNKVLNNYNIAPEQRATLEIIQNDKDINQTKIAQILGKDKTTICRSLTSLEKKGLITKSEIKNDKRVNILKLTKKAEEVLEESKESVYEYREKLSQSLNKDEIKMLFSLLEKITKNV
ncbi:MAG: MarR family winged helix-turn-helix transcriptional regulator [Poseidonibacter sp.]|uniref:MarR family winged helix-turn-helix transcriptional regulator n=1 Tax=Poseidonibacter sp. TaxID=2321188 RepID=UPI00359CD710